MATRMSVAAMGSATTSDPLTSAVPAGATRPCSSSATGRAPKDATSWTDASVHDVASFGALPVALELHGRVAPAGTALVSGSLVVADPMAATDIRVAIRNLVLPDLTPYSAQFMGYAIASGR